MEMLKYYKLAKKDYDFGACPQRNEDATFGFTNGQKIILNQSFYGELSHIYLKDKKASKKINEIVGKMLSLETPAKLIYENGKNIKETNQQKIEALEAQKQNWVGKLEQFEEDMIKRGIIAGNEVISNDTPSERKEKTPSRLKVIVAFILVWLLGEVFMTYVQWQWLRDEKGIEDLAIRSISFGVALLLVHLVGHLYQKHRKFIYMAYLIFNFLMLFTMLFAPLIINQMYPAEIGMEISDQWSLSGDAESAMTTGQSNAPFLVELYRSYDFLPGVLCFLFYIMLTVLYKPVKKAETKPEKLETELHPETDQEWMAKTIAYYKSKIKELETIIGEMKNEDELRIIPNANKLSQVEEVLVNQQNEVSLLEEEKEKLKIAMEEILKRVEMELDHYKIEFMDILGGDEMRSIIIRPEWPTRDDIKTYYKLQTI